MFAEICLYEVRPDRQDETEELMREVAAFYREQPGVVTVTYVKRTHRQKDFATVREGGLPIELTRTAGHVTYVLFWLLDDAESHARIAPLALDRFYKRWRRCLTAMPKIILGQPVT